jgi:Isopropylmalate/homocitrate/citramalate synthases
MVTIIDRTLTTFNTAGMTTRDLNHFCDLLFTCGVTKIELTPDLVSRLGFPANACGLKQWLGNRNFFLTQLHPESLASGSPGMNEPKSLWKLEPNDLVQKNISVGQLDSYQHQKIRITGLEDLMTRDYPSIFKALLGSGAQTLDLCPSNQQHCATAIALEWVLAGGTSISCGFTNHHNFPPLEEVLMGLKLHLPHTFSGDLSVLSELRHLYEALAGQPVAKMKAIIGADIFKVESGIHVDGVLKNPRTYEPFNPQTVGNQREIVLGKHSGRKSLLYKLNDSDLSESMAHSILKQIKGRCTQLGRNLSDLELRTLASEVQNDIKTEIYC